MTHLKKKLKNPLFSFSRLLPTQKGIVPSSMFSKCLLLFLPPLAQECEGGVYTSLPHHLAGGPHLDHVNIDSLPMEFFVLMNTAQSSEHSEASPGHHL